MPREQSDTGKGSTYEGIIAREMLDLGRATPPQIRHNGLAPHGEGPPLGQGGKILPGGSTEYPCQNVRIKVPNDDVQKVSYGDVLHEEPL